MRVRIVKLAAGPRGIYHPGTVLEGPREVFAGLVYEVLDDEPEPQIETATAVPEAEVRGRVRRSRK